ncbi:MAG TPA: hypothetical protein VGN49_10410 [Micrococcaceae bacterium]|nr:hypothetical protein [Micrococcaceae bacterium]
MRSFFAAIAALLALLLTGAAVPAIWADRHIVQESGFVAMAAPLGSDPQFQQALSTAAAKSVTSQLNVNPALLQLVQPVVDAATKSLTSDPGYPAAWTETLRRSHRLTVTDAAQDSTDQAGLTLDVAPLLQLVVKKVTADLGAPVSAPPQVLISLGQPAQRAAIVKLATYAPLGYWAAGAALLVFLLALVIARRRSTTLLLTGLGLAVVAGIWKLGADQLAKNITSSASGNSVADLFKAQFVAASTQNFGWWIIVALLVAAAMVVAGGLGRIFSRR